VLHSFKGLTVGIFALYPPEARLACMDARESKVRARPAARGVIALAQVASVMPGNPRYPKALTDRDFAPISSHRKAGLIQRGSMQRRTRSNLCPLAFDPFQASACSAGRIRPSYTHRQRRIQNAVRPFASEASACSQRRLRSGQLATLRDRPDSAKSTRLSYSGRPLVAHQARATLASGYWQQRRISCQSGWL